MEKLLAKWERLCASSGIVRFVDINLRGIAQVMFQNNPLTGALFLAAIGWGSYAAGAPHVAIAGLLAVVVATLTAQWLRVDEASLRSGLYGYNGILVGLALATFLAPGALMWVYVVLGAAVSVVVMLGTANAVKPWGVCPHVSIRAHDLASSAGHVWIFRARGTALPSGNVVIAFQPYEASPLKLIDLVQGVLQSISQVFLKGSGVAALLLLAGLAVNSLAAAAFALAGADTGRPYGTSVRRRKRVDHRRPPRLQPGLDGDRTRHGVLSAELARRGVHGAGHGVHGHRAGGAERCVDAVRHSGSDRAFRAGDVALPSAAPVLRGPTVTTDSSADDDAAWTRR